MDLAISATAAEAGSGFCRCLAGFGQHHDRLVMADAHQQVGHALGGVGQFFLEIVLHVSLIT
jgi:hypothetical protein